ncbi:MAG: protein-tyrosine-phosphatase [Rhodospirillaceae bacterium]|nr:protein-tyrosine-phosphatase [Rhodospirillaceae bacterium]
MTILVSPFRHVHALVERHKPSHILSVLSPDMAEPERTAPWPKHHLTLRFNDIAAPMEGLTAPSAQMVSELLAFGTAWQGTAPMLVHCWAGISRSTAAAYVLACQRMAAGAEEAIAQNLRDVSPMATPNPLIVALADDLLGREGRMIAAIARIGRGENASEGEPFTLDF